MYGPARAVQPPPPSHRLDEQVRSLGFVHLPRRVPEVELVQVARPVDGAHVVVRAIHASLELREEALAAVRADPVAHVFAHPVGLPAWSSLNSCPSVV